MTGPMNTRRTFMLVAALALSAVACSSSGGTADAPTTPPSDRMQAMLASVDLYVNAPQRVGVGLPFGNGALVSYGTVSFRFAYTGTASQTTAPRPGPRATATYIPVPGTPDGAGSPPTITQPGEARGIYEATGVTFDRTGIWTVDVTADIQGSGPQTATATFPVAELPALPAPGQPALATENLTIHSKGVPRAAIDSLATGGNPIPDPELHQWTIARAIQEHRPALVIFGTPAFCESRFCGPEVEVVQQLAKRYANRAVFIHIEIWRDFQNQVVNKAAADWLYRNGNLTDPWLYLIGADGTILDRWSSLFSVPEVAAELQALPVMK